MIYILLMSFVFGALFAIKRFYHQKSKYDTIDEQVSTLRVFADKIDSKKQ